MYKEKWKNAVLFMALLVSSCLFYFFMTWGEKEVTPEDTNNKEEIVIEAPPRYISDEKLGNITTKAFLQELMGNDYTLLITLFKEQYLNQPINELNELEFATYAQEVGQKIKNNKEVVKAQVISTEQLNTSTKFKIELEFRDGKKKVITLEVENGEIITPVENLF